MDIIEKEIFKKIANQQETQRKVENILNLGYGQFEGEGKYEEHSSKEFEKRC